MFQISYFDRQRGEPAVKQFSTLDKAREVADDIFTATGVVVGIEEIESPDEILSRLLEEANDIQNACNLCGLAQRFAKVCLELNRHPNCTGTDWTNRHAIVRLWLDKLASLNGAYLASY